MKKEAGFFRIVVFFLTVCGSGRGSCVNAADLTVCGSGRGSCVNAADLT